VTRRIALLAAALSFVMPCAAQARVPAKFFGTMWDGDIAQTAPAASQDREWQRMNTTGVRTARAAFLWSRIEPERGEYNFESTDQLVGLAAANGVELLPTVLYAPRWARYNRNNAVSPPKRPADYSRIMGALIRRYGPDGTFWGDNQYLPRVPLRYWQIWNEPHLPYQWDPPGHRDWARDYGALLRSAYRTIHRADPGAHVVLAGLTNRSYVYLNHLYQRGHIRGAYDVAALHPYTTQPSGAVYLAQRFRTVMAHNGDASKPLWITELGLPASRGRFKSDSELQTSDRGMAQFLSRSFKAIAAARANRASRVDRVYWYTWASAYCCEQFGYSGLLRYDGEEGKLSAKPALAALRAVIRRLG
jgi:hypothetical protein